MHDVISVGFYNSNLASLQLAASQACCFCSVILLPVRNVTAITAQFTSVMRLFIFETHVTHISILCPCRCLGNDLCLHAEIGV